MKIKLITLFMNMNLTKDKHCVNCNYYMNANSNHYCQLFPTFEYINMYKYIRTNDNKSALIENINNIPHEYYTCDIARTSSHLCNGNNFSKLIPQKLKSKI